MPMHVHTRVPVMNINDNRTLTSFLHIRLDAGKMKY
jgi:hypothetical protein